MMGQVILVEHIFINETRMMIGLLHQTIVTSDFQSSPSLAGYDVRIFGDKLVILPVTGIVFYKLENDNWSFIQYTTETVNYTRIVGMKEDMVVTCSSSNDIYSTEAQARIYTYSDPFEHRAFIKYRPGLFFK